MSELWVIILRSGKAFSGKAFATREDAIDRACKLLDIGAPVSAVSPLAILSDRQVLDEGEIRMIYALRKQAEEAHRKV